MPHWLSQGAPNTSRLVLKCVFRFLRFLTILECFVVVLISEAGKVPKPLACYCQIDTGDFVMLSLEAVSKMPKSQYASRLVFFAVSCCFRVAILLRLECSNASPLQPNRRRQAARGVQDPAGAASRCYLNSWRLDLLYTPAGARGPPGARPACWKSLTKK